MSNAVASAFAGLTSKLLCFRVVPKKDVKWNIVYDFVFDRLRSVRQDIVIQEIHG